MIQLQALSLQRGKTLLLEQVDLRVHPGQKVGVIGANGSGKSSLFKMILGQLHHDTGDLFIPKGWQIAHMAQEVEVLERSAIDHVLDGDQPLRQLQQAIAEAEQAEEHHKLGELYAQYDAIDGYTATARAEQLLHGLGFMQIDCQRSVSEFSGGWRIRLNLAQALMCRSDLLLLDEPTNHLDLDAALWLEQWLRGYEGTLLLISHDRDFLDRVVTHIAHIERTKINLYRGNYTAFELLRAERLAQQQASFIKQQDQIAHIESFIRRFKAKATKAKQAQSRIKQLERMEKIAPAHVDSPFSFTFYGERKLSNPLLNLHQADLGYGASSILSKVSLNLQPDMRIGLLGPNGAGKSTLIKSLVGEQSLLSGDRVEGENLRIGYFAQHQLEALDLEASPLLHLQRLSPKSSEQEIRNFLGGFGFVGDDALDTVRHFSGGEKARLALSLIAWQQPNLLLMDEPTNHLDLEVRHALTLALQDFPGALILVSHDRHLLSNCVDQFLLVSDGSVSEYEGDLDDYAAWLSSRNKPEPIVADQSQAEDRGESAQDRRERKRLEAERRQQLAPLRKAVAKLEKQLEQLHEQQQSLETRLADPAIYEDSRKPELKELLQAQANVDRQLEEVEEEWMLQSEQLEALSD
ncbi:ATP-binding cassette domain-containing protein [Motiliproteus sp. MSK22-1]|uniref:ATP-binding cassette domain-containing protein n=1 Tax=Motiliproteus sp. MSK22-1 TaxID=1897630 RepID=UPI000977FABE|nr:ATP-binding cassette domain-containing protein [Motiliproteus sp. MSK22-1]OMH39673.1 ABC transporter ATP-binding protein [Motiliproteus sp. MSK22-1]